jgi:hypothetical protein
MALGTTVILGWELAGKDRIERTDLRRKGRICAWSALISFWNISNFPGIQ